MGGIRCSLSSSLTLDGSRKSFTKPPVKAATADSDGVVIFQPLCLYLATIAEREMAEKIKRDYFDALPTFRRSRKDAESYKIKI